MLKSVLRIPCPNCSEELGLEITEEDLYPAVRSKISPVETIVAYRISSEEIAAFVAKKAQFFRSDIKTEVSARYCEKKGSNPHRSYASLRIAFSEEAIDRKGRSDWFEKIGEDGRKIMFIEDVFVGMIKKYQYNRKALDELLGNYRQLELVENNLGANESFIEDIRYYTPPRKIKANDGKGWVIFAARPETIIADMLEDPATNKVNGKIEIHDVYPITKDVVEFIVYLHPSEVKSEENPYVRQILTGDIKIKK